MDSFVNDGTWKHITKKESESLLNCNKKEDEIIYCTTTSNFCDDTAYIAYNKKEDKAYVYNVNGVYKINPTITKDMVEVTIKHGDWKQITKEEAEKLVKPKKDEIIYYTYKNPIWLKNIENIAFCSYNNETKLIKIHLKNGEEIKKIWGKSNLDDLVNKGFYKIITKLEAESLLDKKTCNKDEDDNSGLFEDIYAVRCFLNGDRKMTDKLTMEEAYTFRKAAGNLYRYLTKEYKLGK
jgi:hypothetical protein